MRNLLLENQIKEIQSQYLDLLKRLKPMIENEKYVAVALDSISLFWRKRKQVIAVYLQYIAKEHNAVFYTAATYFDVKNGEQYSFMLMGDLHIFDDPLGKYCEICHQNREAPKAIFDKISVCANDNIDLLEKCEGLVIVLPLRSLGSSAEETELNKVGEKAFIEYFDGIPDLNTYFELCKTADDVTKCFKDKYRNTVRLFEEDIITDDFRARVDRAVDIQKSLLGEGYSFGEYFYFSLFGPLLQAIDILCIVSAYNLIPLIRYPVALHNAYLLLPNFFGDELADVKTRLLVFNALYQMFDPAQYANESLSVFYKKVKNYSFESKALSCYKEDNPKQTLDSLHALLEDFKDYKESNILINPNSK